MSSKNIIFVSSSIQQPRHQKRIRSLSKIFEVFVIYNTRTLYLENAKSFVHPEDKQLNLGNLPNYSYHHRFSLIYRLIKAIRGRPEKLVYSTSIEGVIAAIVAGKKVVHELGDMHQFGSFKWFWYALDSFLVPRLEAMFITSPWFISEYYGKRFSSHEQKFHLLENRMSQEMESTVRQFRSELAQGINDERPIRLGAIGSLRYPRMLEGIRELLLNRPEYEFHIHGDFDNSGGNTNIFEDIPNAHYQGVFKNPQDLLQIYTGIDIVVILYDSEDKNVQWALPNKLYEAIAFAKPILCSKNCCLSSIVERDSIGIATTLENLEQSLDQLVTSYQSYQKTMLELESSRYINSDSFTEVLERLT